MARLKVLFSIIRITVRELIMLSIMFIVKILLFVKLTNLTDKCYELLVYLWPDCKAETLGRFAWAYENNGDIERAISCYQEALKIEPTNAMHYFELGTLFEKEGSDSSAVEYYKKALSLGTDFSVEFKSKLQSKIKIMGSDS